MSDIGDLLVELAEDEIPEIMLEVMPDTMSITGETRTQGPGGGQIKNAAGAVYDGVPVLYEPKVSGSDRVVVGEKLVSVQEYTLTFPAYLNGARINVDPKNHRLVVDPRGNEPAKTFLITSIRDQMGVYFEAICTKEN
jgi:hypothetical protein